MQPIPTKVKNVTVYRYFNPNEPLSEVISTGGSGTYSVGTLGLSVFYNLDLNSVGTEKNPLTPHGKYYATFETEFGHHVTTSPWLYCLDASKQPKFGRTVRMLATDANDNGVHAVEGQNYDFITLGALTDITVSQSFPSPAIGERLLITNGKGNIICTRTGTPHEMGVQVDSGDRFGAFIEGSKNIMITGKTKDGSNFSQSGYTVISGGRIAVFLQEFF